MRTVLMLGVVCLSVGACAGDRDAPGTGAARAGGPPEVAFTATDFAFEGPESIPSGLTTLVLTNAGPSFHHLQLLRLTDGRTVEDLKASMAAMSPTDPVPPWMVFAGGVSVPEPGVPARATLVLEPGTYALVCFVDIPDHVPHMMKGMVKALTVTPTTAPAAQSPTEDVTLALVDYAFAFSAPVTAGRHVLKVVNSGQQPHEVVLARLAPGKTADDFLAWGQTYQGEPPATPVGGAAAMAPGQVEYLPLDLTPGNYIVVCFVADGTDGMPHVMKGMMTPFTVS